MASAKGLNPFAAEFVSPSRLVFSHYPPLTPYVSSFYDYSNVLTPPATSFPIPHISYSIPASPTDFPYPTIHWEDQADPATEPASQKTELVKTKLVVVQQQTHVAVQKYVPPKVARNNSRGAKKGVKKYNRLFDQRIGRKSSSTETTDQKPASKTEGSLPSKKSLDYYWGAPGRMRKRFSHSSDVLPVVKEGYGTTVMIRNIPNKYSRDLLVAFLDQHCAKENRKSDGGEESESVSAFDFVYLPIDFCTGMNKGYAFVNFTNPEAVWKFYLAAHSQTWDSFHTSKIREIAYARIQGKKDLIQHFQTMGFPCKSENVLPVCFSPPRDGSEKEVETRVVGKLDGWDVKGLKRPAAVATLRKVKEGSSAAASC